MREITFKIYTSEKWPDNPVYAARYKPGLAAKESIPLVETGGTFDQVLDGTVLALSQYARDENVTVFLDGKIREGHVKTIMDRVLEYADATNVKVEFRELQSS